MEQWNTIALFLVTILTGSCLADRQYFFIKSQLHKMVVEIPYKDRTCGTVVAVNWQESTGNSHQLWYSESDNIRSKMNDFCLEERKDKYFTASPCISGDETQLWSPNGDRIQHGTNTDSVLEIANDDMDMRARVRASSFRGMAFQAWTTPAEGTDIDIRPSSGSEVSVQQAAGDTKEFFFIKSKANFLVMAVKDKNAMPGAEVIMWSQFSSDNAYQLWYKDPTTGIIRSKLTGYCLSTNPFGLVIMAACSGCAKSQNWNQVGEFIQNGEQKDLVVDIAGYNLNKGARVSSWTYHGGDNQRWTFEMCTPQRCQ